MISIKNVMKSDSKRTPSYTNKSEEWELNNYAIVVTMLLYQG